MEKKMYTEEEYLAGIRGAIGERAIWFYMIMKELKKQGIDVDKVCQNTIFEFGRIRGQKYSGAKTPGEFAEMLYNSKGKLVFEMELEEKGEEKGVLKFKRCPLVDAWKEYNIPLEDRIEICRLACYGDYGRVSCAEGINLEFPQQLSKDQECCELLFTRKK